MNTGFALRLTAAAVAACVASGAGAAAKDGTFTGTGNGRGGQITAAVTFKGGKIADGNRRGFRLCAQDSSEGNCREEHAETQRSVRCDAHEPRNS